MPLFSAVDVFTLLCLPHVLPHIHLLFVILILLLYSRSLFFLLKQKHFFSLPFSPHHGTHCSLFQVLWRAHDTIYLIFSMWRGINIYVIILAITIAYHCFLDDLVGCIWNMLRWIMVRSKQWNAKDLCYSAVEAYCTWNCETRPITRGIQFLLIVLLLEFIAIMFTPLCWCAWIYKYFNGLKLDTVSQVFCVLFYN